MKGTGIQQRYFSELNEDDLNIRAGFTYKLPDDFSQESNIQLGYAGRMVDSEIARLYGYRIRYVGGAPGRV